MSAQRPRLSVDASPEVQAILSRIAAEESGVLKRRVTNKEIVLKAIGHYWLSLHPDIGWKGAGIAKELHLDKSSWCEYCQRDHVNGSLHERVHDKGAWIGFPHDH